MTADETFGPVLSKKGPSFPTTHWSVVLAAGQTASPQSRAALEKLCAAYWYPLYAFLRRCGHTSHDAQDLTQEVFARLLEGNSLETVAPDKGKFRTFMLAALNNVRAKEYQRSQTLKRGGGKETVSLDDPTAEEKFLIEPASALSPEQYYEKQWAVTLLERGLDRLHKEYSKAGKGALFEKLRPFLPKIAVEGQYAAVGAELGMNANAVAVAVHRLRHRYRELIRMEIAETVAVPGDIDEEMRFLRVALSR